MAAAPQAVSAPPSSAAPKPGKRKTRPKGKGGKNKAKKKKLARSEQDDYVRRQRNKPSAKFLKLLRKRARDYNSDDDEEEDEQEHPPSPRHRRRDDGDGGDDEEALSHSEQEEDEEEEGVSTSAVTRFEQGCRAFRVAFLKIMNKKLPDDPLGPILSAHKKLVAAKLAEEAEELKPKGETRKEKRVAAEKGHVIPKDHLDSKEKELIKVTKAQKPRKDLNPSRTKDAKVLAKERKNTFLAELEMPSHQDKKSQAPSNFSKRTDKDEDEPAWAPLRDTYMLGSKLKDWDKMKERTTIVCLAVKSFASVGKAAEDDGGGGGTPRAVAMAGDGGECGGWDAWGVCSGDDVQEKYGGGDVLQYYDETESRARNAETK
ncbi:RRP15-like protein [Panicum miliaceum]|uniref:RRP15-like protein n=1 Tax=Panicum miliaceum TaxID=4540 RepID=A0A3L6TIQ2_PANMI|nr:RRP15-like protein [Panicum miliaceum]